MLGADEAERIGLMTFASDSQDLAQRACDLAAELAALLPQARATAAGSVAAVEGQPRIQPSYTSAAKLRRNICVTELQPRNR